jgi:hypothetical protein
MLPQWPPGLPVIPLALLAPVAQAVINRGARLSASPDEYLEWLSPNDGGKWLDMSHGSAGVLHGLLRELPYGGRDEAGGLKGRARVRLPLISASGSAPLGSS